MKKLQSTLWSLLLMLAVLSLQAQSSKTIREKGIEKITVYEYFIEEGRKEAVVESMEVFNEEGDRIEIQEFNSSGEVKRWEKYSYNEDGKVLEEQYLDEKGKVIRTEKSVYKDGLKVEKLFYNERNKLFKRKVIEYGYRQ